MHPHHRISVIFEILGDAALIAFVIASQVYWVRRLRSLGKRFVGSRAGRRALAVAALVFCVVVLAYNFSPLWEARTNSPTRLTPGAALLEAPFQWWIFGSVIGFLIVLPFGVVDRAVRLVRWALRHAINALRPAPALNDAIGAPAPGPASPARRRFLSQAATAAGAVPFMAGAYGLLYGRLEIETTRQRIKLARLPKAFDGFRIVQLSDLHIGPFMTAREIRKCAEMANALKPDLLALTGDFVTWDASTQGAAVEALSDLKAPFGIFGCLGNHELWTHTQSSITRLFAERGVHILRQERVAIRASGAPGGDTLNLIGVDFKTRRPMGMRHEGIVKRYLEGVEPLVRPGAINILMSHNPNTFDRAAELQIDLSLAGHTHGGQVALEFISPELSPSRLITPYVAGWFSKPGGQLYVNRGIGTIGVPIRVGAPPEITVFELVRD
ncbi:MAG TPA: metallophosphoesterase [Terriglobia bacterium]|nr:metallophosphoesterase [Terriglobia bacterium]